MTRGSQQRPWVLAEVVSTHRRRHRGALWFRAISSASIHSSFFPISTSVASPLKVQPPFLSVCFLLSLCLKHFPHPVLQLSSKVRGGGIKWLSEDVTSKWPGQPLNDETSDRNENRITLSECYWEKQKHLNQFNPSTLNLCFKFVLT